MGLGNMIFSILNRKTEIKNAENTVFDLIIIGGGITGCGIALDAVSRGLKVLLVEKTDFAAGTSSKSTKLIHGGLRYLKQMEIGLVRETGTERAIVHNLAPHLVHPEKMLLPIVKNGTFNQFTASLAISAYDFLANVKKEDRKRVLDKTKTQQAEPLLNTEILKSGIVYSEYRTDDARLTIELVKKASSLGAKAFNYCEVHHFLYENEKIIGVACKDVISKKKVQFRAKYIVSAAGPWVDLLRMKDKSRQGKSLHLTKGVHIVVPKEKLQLQKAVYFDAFDGRMIFAIPRGKVTYIGTSDTQYDGDLDRVLCTQNDVDYILNAVNGIFNTIHLKPTDVVSSWAGLRPLIHEDGKSPSELSRKDEIFESASGLISIAGGKLTGYRKMAERIVDLVINKIGGGFKKCSSIQLKLTENPFDNYAEVTQYIEQLGENIGYDLAWYLTTVYGRNAEKIIEKSKTYTHLDVRVNVLAAEIKYTIENEMVTNPIDFFIRRTGQIYFDIDIIKKHKEIALTFFEDILHWNETETSYWRTIINEMIDDSCIIK
jgi:glycerol-3-phosphate dehydrogenase